MINCFAVSLTASCARGRGGGANFSHGFFRYQFCLFTVLKHSGEGFLSLSTFLLSPSFNYGVLRYIIDKMSVVLLLKDIITY